MSKTKTRPLSFFEMVDTLHLAGKNLAKEILILLS